MTESRQPNSPDPNGPSPVARPADETTIEDLPNRPTYRPTPGAVGGGPSGEGATAAGDPRDRAAAAPAAPRRRLALRWVLAILGVVIVAAGSLLIVSLASGRPATSVALGYMPSTVTTYTEVRLDLPGDQRQKLAAFLHAGKFPGFADQAQIQPKVEDVYDRIIRLISSDQQTYTANIQPWFGGQLALGQGVPNAGGLGPMATAAADMIGVATITDRAKAIDWLTSVIGGSNVNRSTYNGADLFGAADGTTRPFLVAVTDKVLIVGPEADVKAAVDSGGNGSFAQDADVKAALATIDRDYVGLSIGRLKSMFESLAKTMAATQPGVLEKTQLDETFFAMVPAWQVSTIRFDDDALTSTVVEPSWSIGYDAKNETSDVLGHVPSNAVAYFEVHDVGPALTALLAKFRVLPETKPFFDQYDQALSIVGGSDAVLGWWGDAAVVVAPGPDNTIGGGILVHPRDGAAADRLLTTVRGFISLAGGSAGVVLHDEDHNGTKITVVDLSGVPGMGQLPPGYKSEIAFAVNQDVAVVGYGRDFVASVLDVGPGRSLADDARFKALLSRTGTENISASFVDIGAIRKLVEPVFQASIPAEKWAAYLKEIQPYLAPFDATVNVLRKDGGTDRGTSLVTVH
jgi:hypothetical protein